MPEEMSLTVVNFDYFNRSYHLIIAAHKSTLCHEFHGLVRISSDRFVMPRQAAAVRVICGKKHIDYPGSKRIEQFIPSHVLPAVSPSLEDRKTSIDFLIKIIMIKSSKRFDD